MESGSERITSFGRIKRWLGKNGTGYMFLAPTLVFLLLFIIGPIIYSFVLSLYEWRLTEIGKPKNFVFLANYVTLLKDHVFWQAMKNTMVFTVGSVGIELLLGFFVALLLWQLPRGKGLANSIILLPMITAPVVVGLLWRYMLDPQFGVVNYALRGILPSEMAWLGDIRLALPSVILVDVWQMTPFVVLVLHAGLCSISEEWLEAARVDGATYWQLIWHVVLPFLKGLIILVLMLRAMDTYRVFDTIYVLTKGGPGLATETIGIYTYKAGFSFFKMGYAMTLSIVSLAIVLVFSLFCIRMMREED
ncbi:MAG: sugar ABC transporter permease [Firmicutes bacterium]|nr:sugar ABC transporter permease [Bacillota bacterium]